MPLPPGASPRSVPLLVFLLVFGCSGGAELLLPGDGEPADIELELGGDQRGRIGEKLDKPLVFAVTDNRRRPVEGARIAFEFTSAGPGADVLPDTGETDANGKAKMTVVLGTTIGPQVGEARVLVPEGARQPITTFSVLALSENANGIAALSGLDQTGPAGSTLGQPLVIKVTDTFGNPISGVPITWTAEGGGSVSETSNLTNGDGQASVLRTLGPTAGPQTTLAASERLAGSPVTFIHTATAGNVSGLSIVSGNDQTAVAGTELPGDLVVRLVDAAENGVPGAAVTWVVGAGGGNVSPQNTLTDEAGRTRTRWTLGPNPGNNRVDAVVSGVGVVQFRATGTTNAPAALSIVVQPSSSVRNGALLERQPAVQVRSAGGGPAATPGIQVTAQLSGGGGELRGTRQRTTDANGRAVFTDLAIAGAEGPRTLVFTASGFAGATSSVIDVRAIPTVTTITSDSPDPSAPGQAVTVGFRVTAENLTPTGNVIITVSDGGATCSGSLQGGAGSCQLVMNQTGERTLRASYAGSPGFNPSFGTATHRVDQGSPQNRPPDADYNWHCEGLTCQFTDASEDDDGNVVAWNWNFGDGSSTTVREPAHTFPGPGTYTVILTVTDDDGASDQSSASVPVEGPPPPPENKAPHAEFEVHCTDMTCTFEDRSSDDDGTIGSRMWNYGDGSSVSTVPSHTYTTPGKYTVTLTVTDNDGATDSKTHDANPKAPAPATTSTTITSDEPDPSNPGQPITVSFSVTSSSGTPTGNVQIRDANGGGCDGNAPSGSCSYTPNGTGSRTITATYEGNSSFDESSDTEQHAVNQPPPAGTTTTITADNPDPSEPGQQITVSFSVTSASGTPTGNVQIRDANGGGCDGSAPSGSCSYTPNGTGGRTITATYLGNSSFSESSDTESHTVNEPPPPNQAPTAAFNPPSCITGQPCQFTDGSTDPDGNVVEWEWDFDDSGARSTAQHPTHTYNSSGAYDVKLRVRDDDGDQSPEVQHTVTVEDPAPPPNEAPTARIGSISCAGLHCEYQDDSTDPQGADTIAQWSWIFGDGTGAQSQNPAHDYGSEGSYTVTLTVTDDQGLTSANNDQQTITVSASGAPGGTAPILAKSNQS